MYMDGGVVREEILCYLESVRRDCWKENDRRCFS